MSNGLNIIDSIGDCQQKRIVARVVMPILIVNHQVIWLNRNDLYKKRSFDLIEEIDEEKKTFSFLSTLFHRNDYQ